VLAGCRIPVAVIRLAVIVLPLAVPLTCTVLPTGNCCAVPGDRLEPNCVWGVIVTEVYAKASLKKYRPMAARNEDKKVFSGLL
jgi:hypothetical protein